MAAIVALFIPFFIVFLFFVILMVVDDLIGALMGIFK